MKDHVKGTAAVRHELARFLDGRLGLEDLRTEAFDARPVLEIGSGLVAEDTGPGWALFATYLPQLRDRIVKEMGAETTLSVLDEVLKIEASGGMLLADGSRRRTPGGARRSTPT